MDYAQILKALPTLNRKPPRTISEADLLAKARAMTQRGYIHNETSLKALEAYLQGYGVLLSGDVGIGKTLFFSVINPEPIPVLSFNQCHLWRYEKLEKWLDDNCANEILLDDIGWNSEARNYGQKFETLQVALDARLNGRARTHITTNLTNDELCDRFDGHLVDRIYQMCKCFAYPPMESRRDAEINYNYLRNQDYNNQMGRNTL